jgi:hypothetical protein
MLDVPDAVAARVVGELGVTLAAAQEVAAGSWRGSTQTAARSCSLPALWTIGMGAGCCLENRFGPTGPTRVQIPPLRCTSRFPLNRAVVGYP